jgi:hypothetical protein
MNKAVSYQHRGLRATANKSGIPATNSRQRQSAEERAALLEHWEAETIAQLLHERRTDLPRLQCFALQALDQETERFPTEKNIARTVISTQIPERERWIDAALLLLQFGDYKSRALFLLADHDRRKQIIAQIQSVGGVTDPYGKWVAL